jgi:multisubunit Na+/H+ antiporter MnhB subunit
MKKNPNIVPLSGGFMITSLLGLMITLFYLLPRFGDVWGLSWIVVLTIFFLMMLIASIISMTYSPIEDHLKMPKRK